MQNDALGLFITLLDACSFGHRSTEIREPVSGHTRTARTDDIVHAILDSVLREARDGSAVSSVRNWHTCREKTDRIAQAKRHPSSLGSHLKALTSNEYHGQ